MAASPFQILLDAIRGVPREAIGMIGFGLAILAVVAGGAAIAADHPQPSAWLIALSYIGPGALAFGLYWSVTRRD